MNDPAQALAYARADFAEPHDAFVAAFRARFPEADPRQVLDLGCGPGDITRRFARAYPDCRVLGIDGAPAMIELGIADTRAAGLDHCIRLELGYLPQAALPTQQFDTLISNSLLHHLNDPLVLWHSIRQAARPGATVFVMDLLRPADPAAAQQLVATYAADEPEILRHDFYHSLLAAYRPDEIRVQLQASKLDLNIETISDRHLVVWGRA
jgi:trans-aconitate methyltransferase